MGGKNPYIGVIEAPPPKKAYKLIVKNTGQTITVEPANVPYGETGQPGSLLDIAMAHGIDIDHACGGVVACSTCHVWVKRGLESCNPASEAELDQIDQAPKANFQSRLACQCVPSGEAETVEIEIPGWNRNLAREGKH